MVNQRVGKFNIDRYLIDNDPSSVRKIMGQCIVIRAEHMFMNDAVEYIAISDHFDNRERGALIPEYNVIINKEKVVFKRVP